MEELDKMLREGKLGDSPSQGASWTLSAILLVGPFGRLRKRQRMFSAKSPKHRDNPQKIIGEIPKTGKSTLWTNAGQD